jgi:hypothetical protein
MNNFGYGTITLGTTLEQCTYNNTVVDEALQREMMNAETEDQVLELSVERLYQSLKESIKL